jgi:hypothetical protein
MLLVVKLDKSGNFVVLANRNKCPCCSISTHYPDSELTSLSL